MRRQIGGKKRERGNINKRNRVMRLKKKKIHMSRQTEKKEREVT